MILLLHFTGSGSSMFAAGAGAARYEVITSVPTEAVASNKENTADFFIGIDSSFINVVIPVLFA